MAKYMVLYYSNMKASDLMAQATPEEMQASMAEWSQWKTEAEKNAKFEFGMPLETAGKITPEGSTGGDSQVSGYSTMEGEKEAIMDALKTHPNLKRPGASIEVFEMLSMPGIDS